MREDLNLERYTVVCHTIVFLTLATAAGAEVDQRPLAVDVVPAFPHLQWPDDLTGADSGLRHNVLPLVITGAGDGSNRLFVASQYGTIHVWKNDPQIEQAPLFLDIRERVAYNSSEDEEGFLGLAFHPKFKENGEFFVCYTPSRKKQPERETIVSRFQVSASNPNRADPASEEVLLRVSQPFWNHNGGTVVFGPDGFLYIVLGDGGYANDQHMNSQNLQTLLGSILRIDVDRTQGKLPYAIPADNPFVGHGRLARGEIWAYGLRNVWRLTFDRQTGVAWGADVGQDIWEEINIIQRGGNYGWNLREGLHPFGPGGSDPSPNYIEPIWEYHHETGKSITGGHVYRGTSAPQLQGAYLYADYVSGQIWALWYDAQSEQVTANRAIRQTGSPVITFGEDDQGEQYFSDRAGGIFKFAPPANSAP